METTDDHTVALDDPATTGARQAPVVADVQRSTDTLVGALFLWLFPRWIRPNHLTFLRFVLTPVVLILLYYELRWWSFAVFVVAVCTDFIDGAMARTRDQITALGIFIDPVADKLLVGAVLAWIGYDYLVVQIILAFIALELVLMMVGLSVGRPGGRVRPSNVFGKTKMVLQSVALILFLIAGMLDLEDVLTVSLYLLWLAIALAVLSGGKHILEMIVQRRRVRQS